MQSPLSLLARFLRRQTTGLLDPIQLQPGGGELGNLLTALRSDLHFENFRAYKAPNRPPVH